MVIVGRYPIQVSTSARTAAALVVGELWPRARLAVVWKAKQSCKWIAGPAYLRTRARLLGASNAVRWGDEPGAPSEDAT
jgi:hypothetical protein